MNISRRKTTPALTVTRVYPGSVAEESGVLVGDASKAINDRLIENPTQIESAGQNLKVGQKVKLTVNRGGYVLTLMTNVSRLGPKILHDRWGGGPFSQKRFGFKQVITHDSVIGPGDCGGQLLDPDGNVVGINIARSMRVASFAISIQRVAEFMHLARPNVELNWAAETTKPKILILPPKSNAGSSHGEVASSTRSNQFSS